MQLVIYFESNKFGNIVTNLCIWHITALVSFISKDIGLYLWAFVYTCIPICMESFAVYSLLSGVLSRFL